MNLINVTTLFLILPCFAAITTTAQNAPTPDEKTRAFLKRFQNEYTQAIQNEKPEDIARYLADDIRLMPEYQKTIITKTNALTYHRAFIDRFHITTYTRETIEILDLGKRIVEFGLFTQKLLHKTNQKNYTLNGKYINIWERSNNGPLTLITEGWNYNHPVDFAHELTFNETTVPSVITAYLQHVPINNNVSFELLAYNRLQESVITEHNAALWSLFYTDDYMFLYSATPIIKGRKELDAFLLEHIKHLPIFEKLDIRNDRIDDLGTYIIEYASHIAIVRNGDWSGVFTGKDIRIWRRSATASLLIYRGIAMYD